MFWEMLAVAIIAIVFSVIIMLVVRSIGERLERKRELDSLFRIWLMKELRFFDEEEEGETNEDQ